MLIYLIIFALTCWSCKMAETKNKYKKIFFITLTILLPTILAGIRMNTIGTDINSYVISQIQLASENNIIDYFSKSEVEIGYSLLIYITTIISKDYHFSLFVIQLIMSIIIFKIANLRKDKIPTYLTMLVYCFIIYNCTLNIMRQGLAILMVIYSILKFNDKKYLNAIIGYVIALLFHTSAIFAIPIYFIVFIRNSEKISYKWKKYIIICFFIMLILATFLYRPIAMILTQINVLPEKYYSYIRKYTNENINIGFFETGYKLIFIYLLYNTKKINHDNKQKEDMKLCLYILAIDIILFTLSYKVDVIQRVSYYYSMPGMIIGAPYVIGILSDFINKRIIPNIKNINLPNTMLISKIIFITLLFIYWYRMYIQLGFNETYPYISDVIPIFNL